MNGTVVDEDECHMNVDVCVQTYFNVDILEVVRTQYVYVQFIVIY